MTLKYIILYLKETDNKLNAIHSLEILYVCDKPIITGKYFHAIFPKQNSYIYYFADYDYERTEKTRLEHFSNFIKDGIIVVSKPNDISLIKKLGLNLTECMVCDGFNESHLEKYIYKDDLKNGIAVCTAYARIFIDQSINVDIKKKKGGKKTHKYKIQKNKYE